MRPARAFLECSHSGYVRGLAEDDDVGMRAPRRYVARYCCPNAYFLGSEPVSLQTSASPSALYGFWM